MGMLARENEVFKKKKKKKKKKKERKNNERRVNNYSHFFIDECSAGLEL